MESDWLTEDEIRAMLGNESLVARYVAESPLRATNATYDFLVLVREHHAWQLDGIGWSNANLPPEPNGASRQMLNYYEKSSWSKLYVPQSSLIQSVVWDRDAFMFTCSSRTIRATARQVWLAVQDSVTGLPLSEAKIEYNFGKLDGSSPLKEIIV